MLDGFFVQPPKVHAGPVYDTFSGISFDLMDEQENVTGDVSLDRIPYSSYILDSFYEYPIWEDHTRIQYWFPFFIRIVP